MWRLEGLPLMLRVPGRRAAALAVLALVLLVSGCGGGGGGGSDSTSGNGQKSAKGSKAKQGGSAGQGQSQPHGKAASRCAANRLRDLRDEGTLRTVSRRRYVSLPFPLQKTKLDVRPVAVATARTVSSPSGGKGHRLKAAGGDFVVVRFKVRNTGHAATPVTSTVLDRMVVVGDGGKVYGRADVNGRCAGVGPAFAQEAHVLSPLGLLKPGKTAESVAVYVLPAYPKNAGWAARQQFEVFSLPRPQ